MTSGPATVATGVGLAPGPSEQERSAPLYVWLFLAAVILSMFSGHMDELGFPIALDRPLLILAAILVLLDPRRERLRWRAFYPIAALTILWITLSWVSSGSLTDDLKAFALLDRVIVPLAMFPLGALVFRTPHRRQLLMRTAALLGIYLGVVGALEYFRFDSLILPRYIVDLRNPNSEIAAGGPWVSKEPFGMTSALALFLSVLLTRHSSGIWRVISYAGIVGGLIGSVLCMTRSVWAAVLAAGLVIGLMVPQTRRKLPVLILGAVAFGAALLFAFPEFRESLLNRLLTARSVYDRQNTYVAAWQIIQQLPLFGIGWGEFVHQSVLWVRQADTYPVTTVTIEVHNVFLARAAETGIAGTVLWALCFMTGPLLGLTARPAGRQAQQWKLVGLATFLLWFFLSLTGPNPYPTPNILIWLIWGIAARGILVDLPVRPAASDPGTELPAEPVRNLDPA